MFSTTNLITRRVRSCRPSVRIRSLTSLWLPRWLELHTRTPISLAIRTPRRESCRHPLPTMSRMCASETRTPSAVLSLEGLLGLEATAPETTIPSGAVSSVSLSLKRVEERSLEESRVALQLCLEMKELPIFHPQRIQ